MSDINLVLVMKTLSLKMPFYVSSCYVHMTYMPNDYYFRCTMVSKAVAPYFYMLNSLIFRKLRNDTCYIITIKVFMWVDRINCSCFHIKKKVEYKTSMPSGQIKSRDGEIKLISVVFVLSNLKHLIYFTCFYLISFICRWKQNSLWNQQRNPDMPFVSLRRSTMQHSFVPELEEWVKSGEHLWEVLVTLSCIIPMFQFQYVVMVNNPPKTIHCDGFWEQKDEHIVFACRRQWKN